MAGKRRREAVADDEKPVDTTHPTRKRRHEYTESDAKLASLYNDLSDDVKSVRIRAAAELIRTLSDADAQALDKALTRLIRGLCSSRKAARSGFSVALTEVLRLTSKHAEKGLDASDLSLPSLTDRLVRATTPELRSNSQERRDYLLGRCFGFKSLIQSQLPFRDGIPIAEWEKILDLILTLASETLWLRRECGMTLYETVSTLAQPKNLDLQYVNLLISKVNEHKLTKTPEGLAIWITASNLFPDINLPKGVWNHNDPLSSKERATVAKILRDNSSPQTEDDTAASKGTGAAQTTPSFAWQVVLNQLYQRHKPSKKDDKVSDFEKFWIEAVDNGMFAASASNERKALGLQIVSLGIATAPKDVISCIFSPNVMRCIINHRAEADRYLHEAAKGPLLQIITRSKSESEAVPPIFKALLSERGAIDFDKLTKTKTVDELLKRAKGDGLKECLKIICDLIVHPGSEEASQVENRRRMLADMMLAMVRNKQADEDPDVSANKRIIQSWMSILLALVNFAYGGPSAGTNKADPPLSEATQEVFRGRLMSCLTHTLSSRMDLDFIVPEAVVTAVQEVDKTSFSGLRTKADKQILKVVKKAHATLAELNGLEKKKKGGEKAALRAFKALFALSLLQAYNGEADVIGVLEDLEMAYDSWQNSTDAATMLVEILLSFISKPSAVYRKFAQQVFGAFASQISEDGLQSMLDILDKKESLSGQQELFEDGNDVDVDAGADEAIEGEDDSDVEVIDGEDASDVEMDEAESSEDDDDEEGDESAEDELAAEGDEDAEFEQKLADALRTARATDDADSESDGSDMDDDQMMALEGHLTTIFKERKKTANKKKDNKDAKENIVNFKNRVLDLLLIFVKLEHANNLTLELILPMITLIRTTTSKQLSEKAMNLLQQYFGACNKSKQFPEPEQASDATALLKSVHAEMHSNASKVHSSACSRSSLFLAKILVNKDTKNYAEIADMYAELQKEWYSDPKSHIQANVFTEWTSWSIATRKQQH